MGERRKMAITAFCPVRQGRFSGRWSMVINVNAQVAGSNPAALFIGRFFLRLDSCKPLWNAGPDGVGYLHLPKGSPRVGPLKLVSPRGALWMSPIRPPRFCLAFCFQRQGAPGDDRAHLALAARAAFTVTAIFFQEVGSNGAHNLQPVSSQGYTAARAGPGLEPGRELGGRVCLAAADALPGVGHRRRDLLYL